jgi:hypothetical protein
MSSSHWLAYSSDTCTHMCTHATRWLDKQDAECYKRHPGKSTEKQSMPQLAGRALLLFGVSVDVLLQRPLRLDYHCSSPCLQDHTEPTTRVLCCAHLCVVLWVVSDCPDDLPAGCDACAASYQADAPAGTHTHTHTHSTQ